MLIAAIPPPPFQGFELGPLDIRMYGILIAVGAFVALRMALSRYQRLGGDAAEAERILLWSLGAGLVGARIGYLIPRIDRVIDGDITWYAIWEGGLTFFGGLFVGAAVGVWLTWRRVGDVPAMVDAVLPTIPLAQAIGRWGNYFNQELYGRPTDLPWALEVEPAFRRSGFADAATFHPTFLYESLWNIALVVVLLRIDRTGRLRRGSLGFLYMIGGGIGRGWTEALRIDTVERYFGLSRNNWIAIALVIVGIVGLWWWERRPQPAPDSEHSEGDLAGAPGTRVEDNAVSATTARTAGDIEDADVDDDDQRNAGPP